MRMKEQPSKEDIVSLIRLTFLTLEISLRWSRTWIYIRKREQYEDGSPTNPA